MAGDEKSVTWILVASVVFVVVVGWGFLAGSYAGANATPMSEMSEEELQDLDGGGLRHSKRSAVAAFVTNSIEQLPNLPTVVSWHFANRLWLPILIMIALVGVVVGWVVLKRVEQNLNQPRHRRK